jgi:hypothetical protein
MSDMSDMSESVAQVFTCHEITHISTGQIHCSCALSVRASPNSNRDCRGTRDDDAARAGCANCRAIAGMITRFRTKIF